MQIQVQEQVKTGIVSPRQRSWKEFLRQWQAFSFTVPALVLLTIFLIYPIGYVVYLGFQRWNLLGTPVYIGLQNYHTILFQDSSFLQSVGVTFLFVALAVPTQIGLGLFLAILIESKFRGRTFLPHRVLYPAGHLLCRGWDRLRVDVLDRGQPWHFPQLLANIASHSPTGSIRTGSWPWSWW